MERAKLAAHSLEAALHRVTSLHVTVNSKTTPYEWLDARTQDSRNAVRCRVHWLVDCIVRVGILKKLRVDLIPRNRTADTLSYLLWLVLPFEKLHGMQSVKFQELPGELHFLTPIQGMC